MKKLFVILLSTSLFVACNSTDTKKTNKPSAATAATDTANYTQIKWTDSVQDIGVINFGEKPQIKYHFKNVGTKPLFIISAQPGCGCTGADFPKEAISPGDEGVITVGYDSNKGTEGEFRKNVNVTANTKGSINHTLLFNGIIKKAGSAASSGSESDAAKHAKS